MSIGPLRRSTAGFALLALAPLAAMLVTGAVTPVDAATRAVVTVAAVLMLGRVASWGLTHVATAVERRVDPAPTARRPAERAPRAEGAERAEAE